MSSTRKFYLFGRPRGQDMNLEMYAHCTEVANLARLVEIESCLVLAMHQGKHPSEVLRAFNVELTETERLARDRRISLATDDFVLVHPFYIDMTQRLFRRPRYLGMYASVRLSLPEELHDWLRSDG